MASTGMANTPSTSKVSSLYCVLIVVCTLRQLCMTQILLSCHCHFYHLVSCHIAITSLTLSCSLTLPRIRYLQQLSWLGWHWQGSLDLDGINEAKLTRLHWRGSLNLIALMRLAWLDSNGIDYCSLGSDGINNGSLLVLDGIDKAQLTRMASKMALMTQMASTTADLTRMALTIWLTWLGGINEAPLTRMALMIAHLTWWMASTTASNDSKIKEKSLLMK